MKKALLTVTIIATGFLFSGCILSPKSEAPQNQSIETTQHVTTESADATTAAAEEVREIQAVYLGVKDYGAPETTRDNYLNFKYRFDVGGKEEVFAIDDPAEADYAIQNQLKEGYTFDVTLKGDRIVSVAEKKQDDSAVWEPVVKGTPGEKTLKNFIKTALMPVGNTLYIYGGGWAWQDDVASMQARSIGVSGDWKRFFDSQDASYTYKDKDNKEENKNAATSYYPYGEFIEYYYAGLDCSGYLGWTLYNTFETENGKEGYVFPSTQNSKRLADRGWGEIRRTIPNTGVRDDTSVHPGDIISIKGHVWISLGTCNDGSILMAHSSPSLSRGGQPGGGVQIAAIGESKDCGAYKLAQKFMSEYYPEWYERYEADLKKSAVYFDMSNEQAGIFTWNTTGENGGLTDPDGVKDMDPKVLLNVIYKDKK